MPAQILKFSILLFLFFGCSGLLFAQLPNSEDFVITEFGMEDGLPQNSVNEILQTRDGYIWIATFGGLARFDGNTFTKFDRSNTSCMISDQILDIYADSEGAIWIFPAHANTLVTRIKGNKCNTFKLGDGISERFRLIENYDGSIWAYAFNDFFLNTGESLEKVELVTDTLVQKEAIKSKNGTWFGVDKNLYRIYEGSIVKIWENLTHIKSTINYVYNHPTKEGRLLVVTPEGIIEYEIGEDLNFIGINTVNEIVIDLKFDNNNNQYVTTVNGIGFKVGSSFEIFDPFKDQESIRLKSFLQDNEGNFWIGTEGDGLFRFRKKTFSMIDKEDGLQNEKMLSITKLNDGKVLMSTNCDGIYEWKDGIAKLSAIHDFIGTGCYWSVFQDSKGRIWLGGDNPYMTESLDKPGKFFDSDDGFEGYSVVAITEDSKNRIWVATTTGIYIYDGTSFSENLTEKDGLYYRDARSLYEDTSGKMWIGTNGGLNTYRDKEIQKISLAINSESEITNQPHVRAIYEDEDGIFWIGTYGDGLFRIKNGETFHFNTGNGLYDNVVSHIIEDEDGYFWMGSNRGIQRTSRISLNKLADGEIDKVISYSYSNKDGMNSAETNGGFQPSFIYDSDKNIYFPTVAGVAKVSTRDVNKNNNTPPVYIESIKNSNNENLEVGEVKLNYDEAFVQFDYTAINFSDPDKVQFKYRLQGLNDNWVEAGSRREAVYTKIPPGNYKFQVIASNNDGLWNYEGASVDVVIVPPFWQKMWFILLSLAAFGGFVGLLISRRTVRLKQETEQKRIFTEQLLASQENERRRIASEIHDGLGQQILVIKNRAELARKQVYEPNELSEQLDEIMNSAIRSIEDVRNLSHALRPIHLEKFGLTDAISDLCNQLQQSSSMEWSYHIDDINKLIPKEKEINFYRVIQEAINNILKHSSASEASVIVRVSNDSIHTVIWDNGVGFIKSLIKNSDGLGFLGMKERMETLNGKMTIDSLPGEGTTIKINIPLK
ncbi:MAG: two-component regulator propeller domain-containing protein [Balneola sp.]